MMSGLRCRFSCWCSLLFVSLVAIALLEMAQLNGRQEALHNNKRGTDAALSSNSELPHLSKRSSSSAVLLKGKPSTPLSTPRSLTPHLLSTLQPATLPLRPMLFFHRIVRSTREILGSAWVPQLRQLLAAVHTRNQVSVIFSNWEYLESALNWLIAAKVRLKPPIDNVVVFCLDQKTFKVLETGGIPSVYVDPATVANITRLQEMEYKYTVWVMRFVIFRLVNYWGYDLVSYDSDAIVLKNTQTLFDEHPSSDVVGSAGKYPFTLGGKWGFTVCLGVILFRSTPKTGELININPNCGNQMVLISWSPGLIR